jgi:CHRD domain
MRPVLLAVVCLLVALVVGCGGDEENGAADQAPSVVETATEAAPEGLEVELAEENASGQSGTATLTPNEDGTFNVDLELSPASEEAQPAHIHEGSCPDVGDVLAPLKDVVDGTSTTDNVALSLEDLTSVDSPGYAINVHKSAGELDEYVACGDITDVSLP